MKHEIRRQPSVIGDAYVEQTLLAIGDDHLGASPRGAIPFAINFDANRSSIFAVRPSETDGDGNATLTAAFIAASDEARLETN